jgi:hypothetical protein
MQAIWIYPVHVHVHNLIICEHDYVCRLYINKYLCRNILWGLNTDETSSNLLKLKIRQHNYYKSLIN